MQRYKNFRKGRCITKGIFRKGFEVIFFQQNHKKGLAAYDHTSGILIRYVWIKAEANMGKEAD